MSIDRPVALGVSALEAYLDPFDGALEVVAYCRGPHCVLAYEAVAYLRDQGVKARRLEGGMPEWRLAGMPVAYSA